MIELELWYFAFHKGDEDDYLNYEFELIEIDSKLNDEEIKQMVVDEYEKLGQRSIASFRVWCSDIRIHKMLSEWIAREELNEIVKFREYVCD